MDGNYEITDLNVTGAGKILKMKVNGKTVDVVTDITKNADDEITAISINGTSQKIAGGSAGGSGHIYAWYNGSGIMYFSFDEAPADQETFDAEKAVAMNGGVITTPELSTLGFTYTKVSDSEFTIAADGTTLTLTRVSANDVTIW